MQTSQITFLGLAVVGSLALAGCMEGGNATSTSRTTSNVMATERDVEDPGTFSKRENGLWDGRPSLGGVWVAHPDVTSPERVIIRNTENGQETIGALFRRERMNPGPSFQVSGEAASAVGMLAGAPTMIEVVALRIEDAAPAPEEDIVADEATAVAEAPAAMEHVATEAPEQIATADIRDEADLIPLPDTDADAAPRRSGGLLGRIFGRRDAAEDAPPTIAEVETQVIDDAAVLPTAPAASAEAPAQATPQAPVPAPSPLAQPFIQLGIFSVEANARNAERMAKGAGLSARVVAGQASGNQFWRVVVGPANSQTEQRQMLERVRGLGFTDAYAVRR